MLVIQTLFFSQKMTIVKMVHYEYEYQLCPLLTINHFNNCEFCYEKKLCRVALVHYWQNYMFCNSLNLLILQYWTYVFSIVTIVFQLVLVQHFLHLWCCLGPTFLTWVVPWILQMWLPYKLMFCNLLQ